MVLPANIKSYLAELIGTFCLVFVGAGAIAVSLPHFWISVAFGLVVTLMILCFGNISGAHINPAVSVGFFLLNKDKRSLGYIPFQLAGGLLAGLILLLFLPSNPTYGETMPSSGIFQTFLIEVFITFILMLSILLIVETDNLKAIATVVGFVVFLAAYFAGPFTGASMNPARSFGPAVVSGSLNVFWIYATAPLIGGALASPVYIFFRKTRTK